MSPELNSVDKTKKLVATATTLEGSKKTNFSLITHSLISTNLANLAKIGPVNVELIGLTGVVTNI